MSNRRISTNLLTGSMVLGVVLFGRGEGNALAEGVDKRAKTGVDGWVGVWPDLNAAVSHPNGKAYFFKGNKLD